ncbi:SLAM family member 5 isoform X2 [Carassius gibelio]|uniref:SLAM family member 5 isoform X2 n=1 Tax=Carassius gibelio TaxID=101364 RepID=UPI002278BE06|nr:SLAM family member 5 isoform X2 [Carassius gibelio]
MSGYVNMVYKYFFLCLWIWFSHGVFGDTDVMKSVSVMEGDSVTLNADVNLQKDDQILWMFKVNNTTTLIADRQKIYIGNRTVTFRNRLQMDSQTGSMTIRNIRTEHSGLYKLQIIQDDVTYKSFIVAVYAPLPIPIITRDTSNSSSSSSSSSERSSVSRCVLLCSVVNVGHVTLSWYKGNSLLSSISVSDLSISLSLPLEVEYQDKNSYSCVLNNPISNQTQHLDITQLCHTSTGTFQQSQTMVLLISFAVVLVLAVVGAIYFNCRRRKPAGSEVQTCEEEVLYAETTFCARGAHSTKPDEEHHVIYSSVNVK